MCIMRVSKDTKRVQVTIPQKQWDLLTKLRGEMGNSDSEIIKSILTAWLSEKSIISTNVKKKLK